MSKLKSLRRRHARELRALRARQQYQLAALLCSNALSTRAIAARFNLGRSTVRQLRHIWRTTNLTHRLPWEGVL